MNFFKRNMKDKTEEKKEETAIPQGESTPTGKKPESEEKPTTDAEPNEEPEETKEEEKPRAEEKPEETKAKPTEKAEKFIGFYRLAKEGSWILYPKILAAEQSVKNAIIFEVGKVETHIVSIKLP